MEIPRDAVEIGAEIGAAIAPVESAAVVAAAAAAAAAAVADWWAKVTMSSPTTMTCCFGWLSSCVREGERPGQGQGQCFRVRRVVGEGWGEGWG